MLPSHGLLHRPVPSATAAGGRHWACIIASASYKNRPKRSNSKPSAPPEADSKPEATDEQLIRELNTAHLWLPNEQSDDFGMDDIAAHVAGRNQAQVVDFSAASRRGKKRAGKPGAAPPSTLAELDPESGKLPYWVEDLRAAGFDVLGRNGELFLQRGSVPEQQPSSSNSSSSQPRRADPTAAGAAATTAGRGPATEAEQRAAAAAAAAVPDKSLAVRAEFDPLLWQVAAAAQDSSADIAAAAAADAWYAQPSGSSSTIQAGRAAQPGSSSGRTQSSSTGPMPQPSPPQPSKPVARVNVQKQLLGFSHPELLLSHIESCFPAWSANGCWLLDQQRVGVVQAPTPAEAAAALKGVALAGRRAAYNVVQTQSLARDRRVLGLVECLRLTPPRTPLHQHPSIVTRMWSTAKAYWLQAGAAATAAQQQLLAATRAAAAAAQVKQQQQQQQQSGSAQHHQGQLNGTAAGEVPALGPLLVQLQSAGLKMNRQQLAAAQALISSRQEDQLRQQAFVNALWGMSAIGGPLFFEQEMEALCQVAALGRWKLSPFELSDVLWALANARHWCPLLPQLEAALMSAGGAAACRAPELITALWSFATLSHTPRQLLAELSSKGWAVKPMAELPGAQRSSRSSKQWQQQKQKQQKPQQQGVRPGSESESSCRLSELSSSQLSALVWSLACLSQVNSALFRSVWVEVCSRGLAAAADVRQLVRVQQAALAVELEGSYRPTELFSDEGTQQLLDVAAKTFKQQSGVLQSKVHSTYQRSIASTLTKMRVMHVLEDNTTGYSVDITIPALRVAIEADGPSHMSRTSSKQGPVCLGATAMKRRHLQGLGWAVVNVAYTDWDALQSDEARAAYLKKQIVAARAALAAIQR